MQEKKVIVVMLVLMLGAGNAATVNYQKNENTIVVDTVNRLPRDKSAESKELSINDVCNKNNPRKQNNDDKNDNHVVKLDESDSGRVEFGDTREVVDKFGKTLDDNEIPIVHSEIHSPDDSLDILAKHARLKRETSSCAVLNERLKKDRRPTGKLEIFINETSKRIVVMSSNRPTGQALAALIATAIRHKAGYEDSVYRVIDNRTVRGLADTLPVLSSMGFDDDKVVIHVDADMEESSYAPALPKCPLYPQLCSIAGSRLQIIGTSPSAKVLVYAVLSKESLKTSTCFDASYWLFYRSRAVLELCGFIQPSSSCIPVYMMPEIYPEIDLKSKSLTYEVPFCENDRIERNELDKKLNISDSSFVFIDYDLGYHNTEDNVRVVQLSPELFPHTKTVAYRLSDLYLFKKRGPKIAEILNTTIPQPDELRQLLALNESTKDIDEAACAWSNNNVDKFNNWTKTTERRLWFVAFLCKGKSYVDYGITVSKLNSSSFLRQKIKLFDYDLYPDGVDCQTPNILSTKTVMLTRRADWSDCGGVLVPAVGAKASAHAALQYNIKQLIFYDVPPLETILQNVTSSISGGVSLLARSYLNYFKKHDWQRIAVISDDTDVAKSITSELKKAILLKEITIHNYDMGNITKTLKNFRNDNARVFFLNMGYEAANIIACGAQKLGMTDEAEYAWIAREWQPVENCTKDLKISTISYWWQGGNDSVIKDMGGSADIRSLFDARWKNKPWPVLAAPLVEALITMVFRVEQVLSYHPEYSYDLGNPNYRKLLQYANQSLPGVAQNIEQKNYERYNPLVFIYEWRSQINKLVGVWHANSDTNEIKTRFEQFETGQVQDGRTQCTTTTSGEEFNPVCHTAIWASSSVVCVILVVALWWLRRVRLAKSKKREREFLMRLLSRCERTAAVLEGYLVDRSTLELFEELGSGHFGRVRFGMLRGRNRLPTPVAAKTLREDAAPAEEAEFLREGSTMASLSHDHIVRLVGVCADADGPPLLLMEHAFFGDLLKYLRQRRHLAEIFERHIRISQVPGDIPVPEDLKLSPDPEARHVSPPELTRLAREAAEALDYLSTNHILHRDVRAANCLVNARRTLKLADFGMTRSIEAKNTSPLGNPEESDDYKYICRRRGVFPVPWMAPESLERGEFSRATDVWALGVLLLEIATLGARPYGSWKPAQILQFVQGGGRPPLPRDVSYHTCEATEKCWTQDPTERATAKEIHSYLLEHPTAIRAALRPAWPEPDFALEGSDSGFGERVPEEWPKGVDLRVSTL